MVSDRRSLIVLMHLAEVTGPALTLLPRIEHLAGSYDVTVVVPAEGGVADLYRPFAAVVTARYRPLQFPRSPLELFRAVLRTATDARRLAKLIRRRHALVVIVVTTTIPAAAVAARLSGARCITYVGELFEHRFTQSGARRLAARLRARVVEHLSTDLVCCSQIVARQFDERRACVHVIHPGISPAYETGDRKRGRAKLGVSDEQFVVVVAGSITPGRGQDVAVQAFGEVVVARTDAILIVAGAPHATDEDRWYARQLKETAVSLGIASRTRFVGFRPDMPDVFAAADVVVNPARFEEPFGRVALEAIAAGRPVVASRVGAITELFQTDVDAILVEPDDPGALAAAILRLAADRQLRFDLAKSGRRVLRASSESAGVERFAAVVAGVAHPVGASRA